MSTERKFIALLTPLKTPQFIQGNVRSIFRKKITHTTVFNKLALKKYLVSVWISKNQATLTLLIMKNKTAIPYIHDRLYFGAAKVV